MYLIYLFNHLKTVYTFFSLFAIVSNHEDLQQSDSLSGVHFSSCSTLPMSYVPPSTVSVQTSSSAGSIPGTTDMVSTSYILPILHMSPGDAVPQGIAATSHFGFGIGSAPSIQATDTNQTSSIHVTSFPVADHTFASGKDIGKGSNFGFVDAATIVQSMPEDQMLPVSLTESTLSPSLLNHEEKMQQLPEVPSMQKPEILQQGLQSQPPTETYSVQPLKGNTDHSQTQQQLLQQQQQLLQTKPKAAVPQVIAPEKCASVAEQTTQPCKADHPASHIYPVQNLILQQIPYQQGQSELPPEPLVQNNVQLQSQAIFEQMQLLGVVQQPAVPLQQEAVLQSKALTLQSPIKSESQEPLLHIAQAQSLNSNQVPPEETQPQPKLEQVPQPMSVLVQKQLSILQLESELSTEKVPATNDTASLQPLSDSSLSLLSHSETALPALTHVLSPSPAQPSSVAESDSEGPPKIEFVDNRIKTLDEKLRNLLYQEHSGTGATICTHTSDQASSSATSAASARGEESSETQTLPPSTFPLPSACSSDTSPHSSSCTTSSTTSRSSSTLSDKERERTEDCIPQSITTPSTAVERQPASSFSSTSPLCSLLSPPQETLPGPTCESTVLVSWV